MFGKNAELLIDHAWGWEPCTIQAIKAYKPGSQSLGSGQVLHEPYPPEKARLVLREMADLLVLDLVRKGLVTDQIVITVGYDIENLTDPAKRRQYRGPITTDAYGRQVPAPSHGSQNLGRYTSSTKLILKAVNELSHRLVDKQLLIRRLNVVANHVIPENATPRPENKAVQLDLFTDYEAEQAKQENEATELAKERNMQQALLNIRQKFGKNAILRGMNLEDGATTRERNKQIGGHQA
jgi:DNA polymerase V